MLEESFVDFTTKINWGAPFSVFLSSQPLERLYGTPPGHLYFMFLDETCKFTREK